ncbi:hypothetical protein FRB91_004047 [Serendipita sp. 411]|nr:hypothetical protein FRB91_004047 [Serendipita sp. 411]
MRLRSLLPTLSTQLSNTQSEKLLSELASLQVTLAEDLILRSSSDEFFELLTHGLIEKRDWKRLYDEVATFSTSIGVTGTVRWKEEVHRKELSTIGNEIPLISTGIESVDRLVVFPSWGVVEIAGPLGSGKTSLITHLTLKYLMDCPESSATWIDTLGGFSPEHANRTKEKLESRFKLQGADPLTRLEVVPCTELSSAYDILEGVVSQVEENQMSKFIVVIDPITPLLGPGLSATSSKGHALMITFMRHLSTISETHGVLFLVANTATRIRRASVTEQAGLSDHSMSRPFDPTSSFAYKPSLGPSFTYLTDMSLFITVMNRRDGRDAETRRVKVKVLKCRQSSSGAICCIDMRSGCLVVGEELLGKP